MNKFHSDSNLMFQYGDQKINFKVSERSGHHNRVLIKVHPNCEVEAKAPLHASTEAILEAVTKRARWIFNRLDEFKSQAMYVVPRQYISGESHYYLGKQHLLKINVSDESMPQVKLLRGKLEVIVFENDKQTIKQLLGNWYKQRATEVFQSRLRVILGKTLWVNDIPAIKILSMKTQWGSCSPKGKLTLNPHLVKAPRECIDYVILHELCHIAEHNHSDRFYRLMSQIMPKWETVKTRLDNMAGKLLVG
jgi:predicted metal-dependent hydrolase